MGSVPGEVAGIVFLFRSFLNFLLLMSLNRVEASLQAGTASGRQTGSCQASSPSVPYADTLMEFVARMPSPL